MDQGVSDSDASALSFTTVTNPDGSPRNVYVAPLVSSKSKPKRLSKKQLEDHNKEQAKEKEKPKSSKSTPGRKSTDLPPKEKPSPVQNSGQSSGGSSSTAQSLPNPTIASSDSHKLVQEVRELMRDDIKDIIRQEFRSLATSSNPDKPTPYGLVQGPVSRHRGTEEHPSTHESELGVSLGERLTHNKGKGYSRESAEVPFNLGRQSTSVGQGCRLTFGKPEVGPCHTSGGTRPTGWYPHVPEMGRDPVSGQYDEPEVDPCVVSGQAESYYENDDKSFEDELEATGAEWQPHKTDLADHSRHAYDKDCLLYTSPSPRDLSTSRMPSSA